MGKPKMKFHFVGVRLSEYEYHVLRFSSFNRDMTYSDYLRGLLRADADRNGVPPLAHIKANNEGA